MSQSKGELTTTWAEALLSLPDEDFMEGGRFYNPLKVFLRGVQGRAKEELTTILGFEPDARYDNRPGRIPRLQRIRQNLLEKLRQVL